VSRRNKLDTKGSQKLHRNSKQLCKKEIKKQKNKKNEKSMRRYRGKMQLKTKFMQTNKGK